MSLSFETVFKVIALLLYIDIVVMCQLIINKLKSDEDKDMLSRHWRKIIREIFDNTNDNKQKISLDNYFELKQSIQLNSDGKGNIENKININKVEKKYTKNIKSVFKQKRIVASVYLGLICTDKSRHAIEKAITKEKDYAVKLYMANALADIGESKSIPVLVSSLINSNFWYRDKVNMLIADFGQEFNSYLPSIIKSDDIEIKELIIDFSSVFFCERLKNYLINVMDTREEVINRIENYQRILLKAADVLASFYPKEMDRYLNVDDIELKNIAVKSLANINSIDSINQLLDLIRNEETKRSAIYSISAIVERNPEYINTIVKAFKYEKDLEIKNRLADILSQKVEYFIMKLSIKNNKYAVDLIRQILLLGKTSEVIDFLNKNKDIEIENELVEIVKDVISSSAILENEFCTYLNNRTLVKCGLKQNEQPIQKKEAKKDKKLVRNLYIILIYVIAIFPVVYFVRHNDIIYSMPLMEQIKIYVVDFNYYLAYYSIVINSIYLILLLLSYASVNQQRSLWKIKSTSLLFKKKMLPSISIIAPAYNEEKTIIESSNSLLNLKYPDYELVIVNDGSKDRTLEVLIKYFNLTRIDYIFDYKLKTKNIRGVYINRSMPKLIVVDKDNGGKADSLNAGINISNKDYFCGIDADSLLEDEALIKLASVTLDKGVETPALGGNIFPINGCSIERGMITDIKIPKNKLARFQTVEYIRAFMAGRLGWAKLDSLLIISGAFGLFRKERVIDVGGYLTSSGKYGKDTVGEDMELVVRISRSMLEKRLRFKICYAFNANCWTEVPEDYSSLKKQRYRWHRGLIDILNFHKVMIFNPRYGKIGTIAMPYFFIFEIMGPIIEIQGYIMVVLAFLLGLLNTQIALLLFVSTVLMGVLVSLASLLIAEKDIKYFRLKEVLVLIMYSIIENFGPRQLFSFWRVGGYFNMLKDQTVWAKPERKGFSSKNTDVKG